LLAAVAAIMRSEARLRGSRPDARTAAQIWPKSRGTLVIRERVKGRFDVLQDGYTPGALHRVVGRVGRRKAHPT
jgi:hypothetical protein